MKGKEIMKEKTYDVNKEFSPFGGVIWKVKDYALQIGGINDLVTDFINENKHEDYTLSIYDDLSCQSLQIECNIEEIPELVNLIYHLEKASPLTFIGENPITDSYVVGMTLCMGKLDTNEVYKYKNNKLIKYKE